MSCLWILIKETRDSNLKRIIRRTINRRLEQSRERSDWIFGNFVVLTQSVEKRVLEFC